MKIYTLVICLLSFTLLEAQNINYKYDSSEVQKEALKNYTNLVEPLGVYKNFALYRNYSWEYLPEKVSTKNYITKVDTANLNNIIREQVDLTYKDKQMTCEGVERIEDKLYVFSSFNNKKQKKHFLFAQILDINTLKRVGDIVLVGEISYEEFKKTNETIFTSAVSKNGKQIMTFYSLLSKKGLVIQNDLFVTSSDLEPIWGYYNVSFNSKAGKATYRDFAVSDNSEVYVLIEEYAENQPSTFKISKLTERIEERSFYDLSLENKNIVEFNFELTEEKFICNGLYSEGYMYSPNGAFTFTIDPFTKAIENVSIEKIGWDLIEKGLGKNDMKFYKKYRSKNEEWEANFYKMSGIKTKSDGNKYFTAEQTKKLTKTVNNGRTTTTYNIFLNRAIYVINLNANNAIIGIGKFIKTQGAVDDTFTSVVELEKNGNIYFVYNDFTENNGVSKKLKGDYSLEEPKISLFNSKGEQTNQVFEHEISDKKTKFINPRSVISLSRNSVIFQSNNGLLNKTIYEKLVIED